MGPFRVFHHTLRIPLCSLWFNPPSFAATSEDDALNAGQIASHGDAGVARLAHDARDLADLAGADLHGQGARGREHGDGIRGQSANHRQAIGSAVESKPRLAAHLGWQAIDFIAGNVGRVADDEIERRQSGQR